MSKLAVELKQNYQVIGILTLAQISVSVVVFGVSPLTPFIQADLALTRAQVGVLVAALFLGSGLVSFPVGRMVDRYGPHLFIMGGMLVLGTLMVATSLVQSFPTMLALIALAGTGQGLANPALTAAVSLWTPPASRGTAMGIKHSGVPLGAALSAAILPTIALTTTWRLALMVTGLVIVVWGLITAWLLRCCVPQPRPHSSKPGLKHTLRAHVWRKDIFLVMGSQLCLLIAQFGFVAYFVLYLTEKLSFTPVGAGWCLSLAQGSGWLGRIAWGVVSDSILGGNRRITLEIVALLTAAVTFLISTLSIRTPAWMVMCLAVGFGLSGLSWAPTFLNCVTELAGPDMAGTALGMGLGLGYVVITGGPPLLGYLVDWSGSYRLAWQLGAVCALAGFALLVLIKKCQENNFR